MAVAERHRKRADEDVARQKQRALKVEREKAELEAAEKTLLEAEIDAVPPEPVDAATPPVVQHENDPGEMVDDAAPVEYGEEEQQQADEQTEMPYLASQRDGKPAIKRARVDDSDMRQKRCKVCRLLRVTLTRAGLYHRLERGHGLSRRRRARLPLDCPRCLQQVRRLGQDGAEDAQ